MGKAAGKIEFEKSEAIREAKKLEIKNRFIKTPKTEVTQKVNNTNVIIDFAFLQL